MIFAGLQCEKCRATKIDTSSENKQLQIQQSTKLPYVAVIHMASSGHMLNCNYEFNKYANVLAALNERLTKSEHYEIHLDGSRPLALSLLLTHVDVLVFVVLKVSVLCHRAVSSGEVELHRRGRSCDGGGPRPLPHRCLHHRDPHRTQGPAASLHRQSVSVTNNSWRGTCSAG